MKPTNSHIDYLYSTLPHYLKVGLKETPSSQAFTEVQEKVRTNLEKIVFYTSI